MAELTHGMDLASVEDLARTLSARSRTLEALGEHVDRGVRRTSWTGPDADRFRHEVWPRNRALLRSIAEEMDGLAATVRGNVEQQRAASTDDGTIPMSGATPSSGAAATGRGFLAELIADLDDPSESGVPRGKIRITKLANGSVIVQLPGVEDLSDSVDAGTRMAPIGALLGLAIPPVGLVGGAINGFILGAGGEAVRHGESPRDLAFTAPTAFDPANKDVYAQAVRAALEREGVAEGSSIMLVGHSGGAYAASSLAADETFNSNLGSDGRYDVSHVLALGADTDQFLEGMPASTNAIAMNNSGDVVSQAERATDVVTGRGGTSAETSTHHEVWFNRGTGSDVGHSPKRHISFLSGDSNDEKLNQFAATANAKYGGVQVSSEPVEVRVP